MLKFVKNYMETIDGVATYPMISLLIFFVFFAILFWWVFTASKEHITEVSRIPLEEDTNQNKQTL
ncbi:cytochrome C oxidase subunit IV [Sediminicola sp. YIK13]|uniref:CcoQ/FixQ family Cbb3-type cytochrome c oxidase assembly chaperone n=1 Tax=Sediminicola sp. YIK13 TaxID=1453352 RepID=UPI00071F5C46|nr:CcoQ/FixQ family Cbb3-type cytochrome c oxidase assembly chaperone [Sediminicola sp. YIK13]ALM08111.1 cytochrome C oxidase subunit IV [Sediminicola sp. YIK13]